MNPILSGITPNMNQIKQMWSLLKNANNPQAMVSQLMQNNPNFKKVQEIGQQYGGDYKKAFEETAKQMGINPDDILNNLK